MTKLTFNNKANAFYTSVKAAVDQYFISSQQKKTGNWKLYLKSGTLIPGAMFLYMSLLFFFRQSGPLGSHPGSLAVTLGIMGCGVLGLALASVGFNVMHDACHGSYSERGWVNDLMGLSLNALGGNAFIWKFKHNIIHHTYTNVDGIDDDIAKSPLMRQCYSQKWVPAHRFQHIYVVLVYAISSFAWVTMMDFNKYFKRRIVNMPMQKMSVKEHVIFWLSKVLYAGAYILIPAYFVGWRAWAVGFASMHIVQGLALAIVFQLAHVVEHAEFVHIAENDTMKLDEEWAIHQVKTTANFAPRNKIISWYVGGLNFQVEHHLFPRVSHVHYPAISEIVKKTCREFGIMYNEFPTMTRAIGSHFRMMYQLGKKPVTARV
jgi:linoleoyl-CoA desaturase